MIAHLYLINDGIKRWPSDKANYSCENIINVKAYRIKKNWRVKNLANQLTEIIGVILIWRMAICVRPQLICYVQCE